MPPRMAQGIVLGIALLGAGMAARSHMLLGCDAESLSCLCCGLSRRWPILAGLWFALQMPLCWWAIQDEDRRWRMVGYFLTALAYTAAGHIFWSQ